MRLGKNFALPKVILDYFALMNMAGYSDFACPDLAVYNLAGIGFTQGF